MASGDDAAAAGMALIPGGLLANQIDTALNDTRDEIARRTNAVTPVAKGGTGATTASQARTNLAAAAASHSHPASAISTSGGASNVQADQDFIVSQLGSKVAKSGDTMSGHLYLPNSSAAVSSFTVAYINGDGRVSRGSSSERYKKYVSDVDPEALGGIFPQLVRYQMRSGDGSWMLGYIAERLDEHEDTQRFVVRVDGQVESIDFIQLLLAQVANLHARLAKLEGAQ